MYLIIDANNIAHRARHAYQLSYRGVDTSVTFGVMRMLIALIKKFKPSSVIFCWDKGTPNFRRELVSSYKLNRKVKKGDDPTWPVFLTQVQELEKILPHAGVMQLMRTGIEADDLMAHAADMSLEDNAIVSTDEDMLQCVSSKTSVYRPGKKENVLYTNDNFVELVGYKPFQHVAAKVLMGDKSDNIQGVRGVGPKTAQKMLSGQDIPERLQIKIEQFLQAGKYNNSYTVMDLSKDFTGARYVIANAEWQSYSKELYEWCIKKGFTSLIEAGSLGVIFGSLKKPRFADILAHPRIWDYKRYPPVNDIMYDGQEIEL